MKSFIQRFDSPVSWAVAGLILGLTLGVTTLSVSLLAIGFGLFIIYLRLHGPAKIETEGRIFAAGPALMISWLVGFVIRGLVF